MKTKPFVLLAIITTLSVAGAAWSTVERSRATATAAPPHGLFPDLIDQVNDIAQIDVATPKLSFAINRREDGTWGIKERDGYGVKFETIKQAVVGIASMALLETKTAKPELHARLFLKSPKDGGRGTTITLTNGAGTAIAAIVVGKTKTAPTKDEDGIYYVRSLDQAQSYLASGRVEAWETIDRWLDDAMPMINRARVRAATATQPGGAKVSVARTDPDSRDFKIIDIPAGMKALHDTAGNPLGSALGFLDFDDVRRVEKVDFNGANRAVFKTFDGITLTLRVIKHKDGFWLSFVAGFGTADIFLDGLSDEQKKIMKSTADAEIEVADINKRFGPWAYNVPEYKAKDFMTSPDALLVKDEATN